MVDDVIDASLDVVIVEEAAPTTAPAMTAYRTPTEWVTSWTAPERTATLWSGTRFALGIETLKRTPLMKLKARRKVDARRFAAARAPLPNAILFEACGRR